jgi:type I restriction enzyme R subunit
LAFCREKGIDLKALLATDKVFVNINTFKAYANILLSKDEWRKAFNVYDNTISSLYEACKPEILGQREQPLVFVFEYLRGVIDSIVEQQDIDAVSLKISALLDESVVVDDSAKLPHGDDKAVFQIIQTGKTWDLSKINFEKLEEDFKVATFKNIEITDLRVFIERKLDQMIQQNVTRMDFAQRLQEIIDTYNAGGSSTENYYDDLMNFAKEMRAEDERHVREGLTEDELELFDLLKKDKMTKDETQKAKLAAKSLLHRLLEEHPKVLVQDWYKDSQSQKKVRAAVEKVLDENLPDSYDRVLFRKKCDNVYELIFDYASKGQKWAA